MDRKRTRTVGGVEMTEERRKEILARVDDGWYSGSRKGAYLKGANAALDGEPATANPYDGGWHSKAVTFFVAWRDGYKEALKYID
jgi:hypothetical protein